MCLEDLLCLVHKVGYLDACSHTLTPWRLTSRDTDYGEMAYMQPALLKLQNPKD
jgi:hypothetical protein